MDDTIRDDYDMLLHLAEEVKLPHEELVAKAKVLFPNFTNTPIYDDVLGSYEIEVYQTSRAMGLSVEDAAYSAEVSKTVMQHALSGEGLSVSKFVALIKAELFASAELVIRMLRIIEKADNNTEVNAAIALLEKIAPEKYGKAAGLKPITPGSGKGVVLNFSLYEEDEE